MDEKEIKKLVKKAYLEGYKTGSGDHANTTAYWSSNPIYAPDLRWRHSKARAKVVKT